MRLLLSRPSFLNAAVTWSNVVKESTIVWNFVSRLGAAASLCTAGLCGSRAEAEPAAPKQAIKSVSESSTQTLRHV
jgi:hypothetical protein